MINVTHITFSTNPISVPNRSTYSFYTRSRRRPTYIPWKHLPSHYKPTFGASELCLYLVGYLLDVAINPGVEPSWTGTKAVDVEDGTALLGRIAARRTRSTKRHATHGRINVWTGG